MIILVLRGNFKFLWWNGMEQYTAYSKLYVEWLSQFIYKLLIDTPKKENDSLYQKLNDNINLVEVLVLLVYEKICLDFKH